MIDNKMGDSGMEDNRIQDNRMEDKEDYLSTLNERQLDAVTTTERIREDHCRCGDREDEGAYS